MLSAETLKKEVNSTVGKLKTDETERIHTFLNYLRINMRSNYLVSALNTNFLISTGTKISGTYRVDGKQMFYPHSLGDQGCGEENPHDKSVFFTKVDPPGMMQNLAWIPHDYPLLVKEKGFNHSGFHAACTPLEAILLSTLDCLYQMECLEALNKYFPRISEVHMITTCFTHFFLFAYF
jgi:hypothetical protein